MSDGQSISAIGNYGSGNFGAYGMYDPTMMSMMSGYGMTNPMMSMMGGYGMGMMGGLNGMYGGSFMTQQMEALKEYYKYMEDLEKQKLEHATEMHKQSQLAEVANLSAHDQAFFMKAMEDGYVQQGIRQIHDAIRTGNMDYVVQKFYELKQEILNKFSDHFKDADGNVNSKENINNYIRILYSEIAGGYTPGAPKPDLINDIKAYGETPMQHAFNSHWLGNKGHNKLNAEEALNQMFGTGINDAGSKKNAERIGTGASIVAELGAGGVAGAATGVTAFGLGKIFAPDKLGFGKLSIEHNLSKKIKNFPKWVKWGFGLGMLADGIWQWTR